MAAGFGLSADFKAIKRTFLDRKSVTSALDRSTVRTLGKFGSRVRMISRRSMRKGGRRARVSQFDPELRRLVDQEKREHGSEDFDIRPRPIIGARPGRPPKSRSRNLKDRIFFHADLKTRSVLIGPQAYGRHPAADVIEVGGEVRGSTAYRKKWVAFWSNGKRKIRLVSKGGGRVRLKPRPYMLPAYETATDQLVPGLWKNSL